MTHAFLHHRQHLFVIAAFGVEQAIRLQPDPGKRRREEIATGERPEHLPPAPGETGGGGGEEQGRGGIVVGAGAAAAASCSASASPPPASRSSTAMMPNGTHDVPLAGAPARSRARTSARRAARRGSGASGHATRTHMFALCSAFIHSESS